MTSVYEGIVSRLQAAEARYRLPPGILSRIARVESSFNPRAESAGGDRGLLQLSPYIVRRYGIKDPFDLDENIAGGARLLRDELAASGGNLNQAVRAYNVGRRRARLGRGADYARRVFSGRDTIDSAVAARRGGVLDDPNEFLWYWPTTWGSAFDRIPNAGVPIVIGTLLIILAIWRAI